MVDIKGFKEWLEKQELAELSRRAYLNAVRSFMLHGFEEWTVQNGMRYRQMLVDEDMKPASINLMVSGLNRYAKWEGKETIKRVKVNEEPFAVDGMEVEDFHRLIDRLLEKGKYNWYIAVKLLAGTGTRIGEAVQITYGDFRRGHCSVLGKGGKRRTVYFSHALRETLFPYAKDKADSEPMIPYSKGYVRNALLRIKSRYGFTCHVNPHEYRNLFARQMFGQTNDIALLKGLLGHENVKTTSRYIKKTSNEALRLYGRVQNW